MQGIGPATGGLAMNALSLALVASALSGGELCGVALGPSPGRKAIPVARDGDILQSQINADGLLRGNALLSLHPHR